MTGANSGVFGCFLTAFTDKTRTLLEIDSATRRRIEASARGGEALARWQETTCGDTVFFCIQLTSVNVKKRKKDRGRGRPKSTEQLKTISTRVPVEVLKKVEVYRDRIKAENPGRLATSSDAIRELLILGIRAVEQRDRKSKGRVG